MRLLPLERLEDEVIERFGRGAAVSVDRRRSWVVVTVWDRFGFEILNAIATKRDESIRIARELVATFPWASTDACDGRFLKVAS